MAVKPSKSLIITLAVMTGMSLTACNAEESNPTPAETLQVTDQADSVTSGGEAAANTETINMTEEATLNFDDLLADIANWREIEPENLLVFNTTKGRILIETYPEIAPLHVAQITQIVRDGSYDGTPFHRVIEGFMAQGGDVTKVKEGGSGLPNIEPEFTFRRSPDALKLDLIGDPESALMGYYKGLPMATQAKFLAEMTADKKIETWPLHCEGITSMARTQIPNSANSQFFLMRGVSPWLDKQYSAWGRVVEGLEVVKAIKLGEPVIMPDILTKAELAADMAEAPRVVTQRTDGPIFQTYLAEKAAEGVTNPCYLPPVPSLVK